MTEERKRKWDEPAPAAPAPVSTKPGVDPRASEAAAAAAAIAAKIAASLRPGPYGMELIKKDEGEYYQDIEINDLRNRYVLTKGATQQQVCLVWTRSRVDERCGGCMGLA
jgi:hypothetical protein